MFQSVEQDRHVLRRKLHSKESELDARIIELQNDIQELQTKLQAKENLIKQWDKEKTSLVTELRAQNSRLTQQLKDAVMEEQKLRMEVDSYREQIALGKNNLQVSFFCSFIQSVSEIILKILLKYCPSISTSILRKNLINSL